MVRRVSGRLCQLVDYVAGVGRSGSPTPRLMTSTPRAMSSAFSRSFPGKDMVELLQPVRPRNHAVHPPPQK